MGDNLSALTTIFTEFYYWVTVVIMFLIHVGFCMYEVGVSPPAKSPHDADEEHDGDPAGHRHLLPVRLVDLFGVSQRTVALRGQWSHRLDGVTGATQYGPASRQRRWARSRTRFGIVSTACSGRPSCCSPGRSPRSSPAPSSNGSAPGAFWIIAVMIGSVTWIIDAAWGWHFDGWMVKLLGYHDAYASGVIHAIAGGAALACCSCSGPGSALRGRRDPARIRAA